LILLKKWDISTKSTIHDQKLGLSLNTHFTEYLLHTFTYHSQY
jgi:hypothetical protein